MTMDRIFVQLVHVDCAVVVVVVVVAVSFDEPPNVTLYLPWHIRTRRVGFGKQQQQQQKQQPTTTTTKTKGGEHWIRVALKFGWKSPPETAMTMMTFFLPLSEYHHH